MEFSRSAPPNDREGGKSSIKTKKKRKKSHKPVTEIRVPIVKKKCRTSSELISRLHQFNKQRDRVSKEVVGSLSEKKRSAKLEEIDTRIKEIGGLDLYQHVSKSAESQHGRFNSAKWVIQQINRHKLYPEDRQLQLLDVGALDLNYQNKRISCTAIDLNPQKLGITKADFLQFRNSDSDVYDMVVLSLVLNFAGDVSSRGNMLRAAGRLCRCGGHVIVVLPLACLDNSRYMTDEHLEAIMSSLGLDLITSHNSHKLSFKLFLKTDRQPQERAFPKKKLRNGAKMNNFTIVLS